MATSEFSVFKEAENLISEGIEPSIRKIQARIGGDSKLIQVHLKKWREKHQKKSEQGLTPLEEAYNQMLSAMSDEVADKLASHYKDNDQAIQSTVELVQEAERTMKSMLEAREFIEADLTETKKQLSEANSDLDQLKSKLAESNGRQKGLNEIITDLSRQNTELSSALKESKLDIKNQVKEITDLKIDAHSKSMTIVQMTSQQKEFENEFEKEKNQMIHDHNKELSAIRALLEESKECSSNQGKQIRGLTVQLAEAGAALNASNSNLERITQDQNNKADIELTGISQSLSDLMHIVESLTEKQNENDNITTSNAKS